MEFSFRSRQAAVVILFTVLMSLLILSPCPLHAAVAFGPVHFRCDRR